MVYKKSHFNIMINIMVYFYIVIKKKRLFFFYYINYIFNFNVNSTYSQVYLFKMLVLSIKINIF